MTEKQRATVRTLQQLGWLIESDENSDAYAVVCLSKEVIGRLQLCAVAVDGHSTFIDVARNVDVDENPIIH